MPKYQIILESNEQIPSDEFADWVRPKIEPVFKILEARNLQGIRPEVLKSKEDISDLL